MSFKLLFSSTLFSYSALTPVKYLSFPASTPFNVAHDLFLNKLLLNPHLNRYPPSEVYQQSFWKWAIERLEGLPRSDEDDEIDDRIYAHYLCLITSARSSATPSNSFVTYYWKFPETHGPSMEGCYETITLLESRTTIEAGTTGLRTWKASLGLARYLIQHPDIVDTSNVLELGSGTGFIGMLAASLHLRAASPPNRKIPSVYLTDISSTVLGRSRMNVELPCNKSSSHPNVHCTSLDWLDSLSCPEIMRSFFNESEVDIVLGADIVFDTALVPPLVQTLSLALSFKTTRMALIALTVRNEETLRYFLGETGKVLRTEEIAQDATEDLLLRIADQLDAELEVKIFKVTQERDVWLS